MLARMGISNRLNLIIITINLVMLITIAAIASRAADSALRNQAVNRFAEKNLESAERLDILLQAMYTTTENLATSIAEVEDLEDASALRLHILNFLSTNDNSMIHRVNVIRPDGSIAVLTTSDPADVDDYQWRVYRQGRELPHNQFLSQAASENQPLWFRQNPTFYDPNNGISVSLTVPYSHAQGDSILWVDLPVEALERVVLTVVNSEGLLAETTRGYILLTDASRLPLLTLDLPDAVTSSVDLNRTTRQLFEQYDRARVTMEGLTVLPDPFNNEEVGLFGVTTMRANNWQFLAVFPESEIPELPSNLFLPIAVVALAGIFVLTYAVNSFIARSIVTPLVDLGRSAAEIGEGNLRYMVFHLDKLDEIGRLANAMEAMKVRLRESYDALEGWSRTLEDRVRNRTQELAIAQRETTQNAQQLQAVYDESLSVVNESQLGTVLDAFIVRILSLLDASYCGVWLMDKDRDRLQLVATNDARRRITESAVTLRHDEGIAGQAILHDRALIVNDYLNYEHRANLNTYYEQEVPFTRALCAPLKFAGIAIGAVVVGRPDDAAEFVNNDLQQLMLFTNIVSPSVRNAQLFVQLQDAVREAERANQVKTRFLASVTHELRTPLNLIINNMDFMRVGAFGDVTDEQISRLNQTVRSAEHLLYLINDLLDVSKIEAGEMQLFIQKADIYTMLEDAVDNSYALIETYEGKENIELNIDVEDDLPEVPMDARRIRQVLNNLLSNAIKFTQEGAVTLKVFGEDHGIHFSVHDTGMGIPRDEMDKLFSAFERTTAAKQRGIEGTGLGLPISRFLVRQHGSDLAVISEEGVGTTFTFTLPFETPETNPTVSMSDTQQITAILSSRTDDDTNEK